MVWAWCGASFALALTVRWALRDTLSAPVLQRTNYAGRQIPTSGGVVALVASILTIALMLTVDRSHGRMVGPALTVGLGFGAVGLFDDLVGTHAARGLRGHVRALARGRLTSGATKLIAGVAVAAIASAQLHGEVRLADTIAIAGAANVGNLLDLAPARAAKVALLVAAVLLVFSHGDAMVGPALVLAAFVALIAFELREALMLGDAGANVLGATVGLMAVTASGRGNGAWIAVAAVVAINTAGEFVSFSRVIERVAPLRALDRLGRR
jgi:hypothetical protein